MSTKQWSSNNLNHSIQEDNINCGVYICFFATNLLCGQSSLDIHKKDIILYRIKIKQTLQKNSTFKSCCKCDKVSLIKKNDKWIKTKSCLHRFHGECLNTSTDILCAT
jgi:hypothetical protein